MVCSFGLLFGLEQFPGTLGNPALQPVVAILYLTEHVVEDHGKLADFVVTVLFDDTNRVVPAL